MRKDIIIGEVSDVAIAISPEEGEGGENVWVVYFLNLKKVPIESVLVNAQGKGMVDGEERQTATMRFFLDRVEPGTWRKLEILLPEAFVLNNQYWVSFYEQKSIFDKKYLFEANSISEDNFVMLPLLNKAGVLAQ